MKRNLIFLLNHTCFGGRMPYDAADNRYESAHYRRCGKSGLHLPEVSLGLWYNFAESIRWKICERCSTIF